MKHENNEEEFRDVIIKKLEEYEVSIFNLRKGTLDAFLEDYCLFVEFKIMRYMPVKFHENQIQFNENQTYLLRTMERKPYILVKKDMKKGEEEAYYLFNPEATKNMANDFKKGELKEGKQWPEWWYSENDFEAKSNALKFSNVTDLVNSFIKDLQRRKHFE